MILKYMARLTIKNFDRCLEDPNLLTQLPGYPEEVIDLPSIIKKKNSKRVEQEEDLETLASELLQRYKDHHFKIFLASDRLKPTDYFSEEDAWRVCSQVDSIKDSDDILKILHCDILKGGVNKLFEGLSDWRNGSLGQRQLENLKRKQVEVECLAEQEKEIARSKDRDRKIRTEENELNKKLEIERKRMIQETRKRKAEQNLEASIKAKHAAKVNKQMIQ